MTQWAAAPQADRLPLLRALTTESLVMDDGKHAFRTRQGGLTYGLLGVINMAHGEMLMIGAYSCWLVQQALAQLAPQWLAFYPLVALPVAFLVS